MHAQYNGLMRRRKIKITYLLIVVALNFILITNSHAFPKENLGDFIYEKLDLKSFPSSFGPKSAHIHSLKDLVESEKGSLVELSVSDSRVYVRLTDWVYEILVIDSGSSNPDKIEYLLIEFSDKARLGTYNTNSKIKITESNLIK